MIRILISVLLLCPAWALGQPVASKATWPLADASSIPSVKSDTLRVMAYNIRVGKGMDLVNDLERTAGVIGEQRPDVVMLQEVDSVTSRTGRVDQAQELGRLTGMHAVFASAIRHAGGKYGVALLSREPPLSVKRVPLPGREEERALLFVEFEEFIAASTHFSLTEEDRVESARIIIREAALCGKPLLVGGDFNAHPGTEPLEVLLRELELLSDGVSPTFPADNPDRCIDYIFGSAGVFRVVHSEVVEEPVTSDHRPVVVHVVIGNNK